MTSTGECHSIFFLFFSKIENIKKSFIHSGFKIVFDRKINIYNLYFRNLTAIHWGLLEICWYWLGCYLKNSGPALVLNFGLLHQGVGHFHVPHEFLLSQGSRSCVLVNNVPRSHWSITCHALLEINYQLTWLSLCMNVLCVIPAGDYTSVYLSNCICSDQAYT